MYVGILKDQSVFNSGIFMREADLCKQLGSEYPILL